MMIYYKDEETGELYHYGIKGQRWGIRRYQNEDGSYTPEGRIHYGIGQDQNNKKILENKNIMRGIGRHSIDAPKDLCEKVEKVNGGKIGYTKGYNRNQNCNFCTIAYEQISRGKQVRAKASTIGGYENNLLKNVFSDYKDKDYKMYATDKKSKYRGTSKEDYQTLCSDILSDGKNSRGTMQVYWKGQMGGHIFNYEVKNGKIFFVDGQVSKVMNQQDAYDSYFKNAYNLRKFRTDNKKMNKKADLFVESNKLPLNMSKIKQHAEPRSANQLSAESFVAAWGVGVLSAMANSILPGAGILISFAPQLIDKIYHIPESKDAKKLVEEQKKLKLDVILGSDDETLTAAWLNENKKEKVK